METVQKTSFEDAPLSPIHKKIIAGTFMGQICDGYTIGIVGIDLSYAATPLGLNSIWMGLIGAGSMFGLLFGSLFTGMIADKIGRKPLYIALMFLSAIVGGAQFFLSDPLLIVIARFALGILIGADYTVAISLLSEWSPSKKRPNLLAWLLVFWTLGYCISYIVGFFMDGLGENGWRYVLCTSIIPAAIAFALRIGTPESPKWLTVMGRGQEALETIKKYLGDYGLAAEEEKVEKAAWMELFAPAQWRSTIVSGVFFFAQVLPFFAISIFVPLVLTKMNIQNPHASGVLYNVSTIVGVLFGTWLFSIIRRRTYLLSTFYLAAIILAVMIIWQGMPAMLAMIMVCALATVLAVSIVPEFAYPPELFPTKLRASGVGLTIAISRIGAGGGTFLLPIITEQFGIAAALWCCVATLVFGGVICQMWAPETSGK